MIGCRLPSKGEKMRQFKGVGVIVVVLAVAACGSGSSGGERGGGMGEDEGAVRGVMADLQAASREGDSRRICNDIYTPKLSDSVTSASKSGSCPKEVRKNVFDPKAKIRVEDVKIVDPVNARARVVEQNGT